MVAGEVTEQVECILNVSEGRKRATIEALAAAVEETPRAWLLDVDSDRDHHRTVYTFFGDLEGCTEAAYRAVTEAVRRIDLRRHRGVHPRVGAADVVPFVPLRGVTAGECVQRVRRLAARLAADCSLPVYLYEEAAARPERSNLAEIRRGGLEGLAQRLAADPDWAPDYGPNRLHPTAGACVIGVRKPLIAFNLYLESSDVRLARRIARRIRERDGGLPGVKALGLFLKEQGRAQVSVNLTDYRATGLATLFERVREEARRAGSEVAGSELIGLVPREALPAGLERQILLEDFSPDRILENRIARVLEAGERRG